MSASEGTPTASTLVVHHLNDSRSQRILWLLVSSQFPSSNSYNRLMIYGIIQEELEVPYEIKKYQRTPEMVAPAELSAIHPLGGAPVITDGEVTLAESGAIVGEIIHYLCYPSCLLIYCDTRIHYSEIRRRKSCPP